MNIGTIIETIIGLVFIYLILSLLASEFQEAWGSYREYRAKHLKNAIKIVLGEDDDSINTENSLTELLYKNPTFKSLNQSANNRQSVGPSYIDSEFFAYALLEVIQKQLTQSKLEKLTYFTSNKTDDGIKSPIEKIKESINQLKFNEGNKEKLKTILDNLVFRKEDPNFSDFIEEIKAEFDRAMIRSSGVYKRNAKGVSLLVGFLIAFGGNIDTFYIVDTLYKNNTLRSSIVEQASKNLEILNPNERQLCLEKQPQDVDECLKNFKTNIDNTVERIEPLPIGWNFSGKSNSSQPNLWIAIPKKLLGLLISAVAISMGAPFWFDLLGRVMNVRNAGKPSSSQPTDSSSTP